MLSSLLSFVVVCSFSLRLVIVTASLLVLQRIWVKNSEHSSVVCFVRRSEKRRVLRVLKPTATWPISVTLDRFLQITCGAHEWMIVDMCAICSKVVVFVKFTRKMIDGITKLSSLSDHVLLTVVVTSTSHNNFCVWQKSNDDTVDPIVAIGHTYVVN